MDDLVTLERGAPERAGRRSSRPRSRRPADAALDEAIATFRRYRRIAGDARARNRILAALYKGG